MIMFVHGYKLAVKGNKGYNILYQGNDLSFLHELVIFSVGVDELSALDLGQILSFFRLSVSVVFCQTADKN